MFHLQNLKHVNVFQGSYTNGATATGLIDTLGYDEAVISVTLATSNTTSNNPSAFNLQECDTSNGTFANVSGFLGDTDWTIPSANTSNATIFQFHAQTASRKRYLKLLVSPTTTQIIGAKALLGRAEQVPNNTTKQGTVASVNG